MSVQNTLKSRQKTHGSFEDHAACSQKLKAVMRESKNWNSLTPSQKEALEMNAHKVARILSGDPNAPDHWHDIQGYAALVEKQCG